jgi:hypothetical protein
MTVRSKAICNRVGDGIIGVLCIVLSVLVMGVDPSSMMLPLALVCVSGLFLRSALVTKEQCRKIVLQIIMLLPLSRP